MGFNTDELNKPLDSSVVKSRSMSGRTLSYVEAWYVIDRLNQVFGFDGWERETLKMDVIQQEEKESNGRTLYYVGYVAKVRVIAGGITREGTGFGQGQDADLGRAHESAVKEAESDAMKRAAMTFGYQFGLALYDKTQEHVEKPVANTKPNASKPVAITDDPTAKAAHHMKQIGWPQTDRKGRWLREVANCGGNEGLACERVWLLSKEDAKVRAEELAVKEDTEELAGKDLQAALVTVVDGGA